MRALDVAALAAPSLPAGAGQVAWLSEAAQQQQQRMLPAEVSVPAALIGGQRSGDMRLLRVTGLKSDFAESPVVVVMWNRPSPSQPMTRRKAGAGTGAGSLPPGGLEFVAAGHLDCFAAVAATEQRAPQFNLMCSHAAAGPPPPQPACLAGGVLGWDTSCPVFDALQLLHMGLHIFTGPGAENESAAVDAAAGALVGMAAGGAAPEVGVPRVASVASCITRACMRTTSARARAAHALPDTLHACSHAAMPGC